MASQEQDALGCVWLVMGCMDEAECSECRSWGSWFAFWLFLTRICSAGAMTGLWSGYRDDFEAWFGLKLFWALC